MATTAGALSQDGRRRRSPLATAASHEWRHPPQALGLPRLALMDGNIGCLGRTKGGRWREATRSVTAIRLELGDGHLPDKVRRAFVFEGHFYAFARQVAFMEAAG
jgi:hypothetical protein